MLLHPIEAERGMCSYVEEETGPGGDSPTTFLLCPRVKLQVPRLPPDFLAGFEASVNLVRLSLKPHTWPLCSVVENPESARDEQKIKPIESISVSSVHFSLNLPQASQFLGMTKSRLALHLGSGGGWMERANEQSSSLYVESPPVICSATLSVAGRES
jgi:hypothetical protein